MTLKVELVGANGKVVKVNDAGQLTVAVGEFDLTEFNELAVDNTAYNFFTPKAGLQLVLTGILAYADKQVASATNSTVDIYEAAAIDTVTAARTLLRFELGQNQSMQYPSARILCNHGVYINAKADDDDVHMTLLGHYIPIIEHSLQ